MAEKRTVHQLVHTLSYGDAISSEVFSLQRSLRQSGCDSEIFAINVNPRYTGKAHDYRDLPLDFDGQIVLHLSLGSPLNDMYRKLSSANRSLIYHNLTPPKWFAGVNPRIVSDIERGAKELPELCAISNLLIADSKFNASELEAQGFKSSILELPVDPARWDVETNPGVAALVRSEPGIHLLHVGRLAPNKCIEDIIKIFHFLHHYVEKQSRLWLVGIDIDTELYSFSLKRLAKQLQVERFVNFCGCMADAEIKALYENASAYICMSEHEGFCLPVVEAMHFGVPVIANSSSALPDTVGGGGILVSSKKHAEIAELIGRLHRDGPMRQRLIEAGKKRVADLAYEKFEQRVREVFGL